ncbi:MAG: acetyl-CoA hydrolase/transferase C-terminal domain-containing protein, partial [Anaerovoracaceae bacterium]
IHLSEVDMVVEGENEPLIELSSPAATENDQRIATHIVKEMTDGAVIQLGIGGMPNAVGQMIAKSDLKDLGIHTELLVDAYRDMYEAGKITNKRKNINRGKGTFGFALGSSALYEWIRENPGMVSYPVSYMNAPEVIGQLDNFISINSCISVDLYGQICAESAGTRHISGTGGQLDFLTGGFMSKGGKSFICMESTFKDKEGKLKSRFLPTFSGGDIVTDPRSQSFYLVTEQGIANLAGTTSWERAEKLISLAHPEHRDDLIAAAEKQKIWLRSNKR